MSYRELYEYCQTLTPKISTTLIKEKTLAVTGVSNIRHVDSNMEGYESIKGYYLSAEDNENTRLVQQCGCDVIVLERGLNGCWGRFVFTKELMHLFDKESEYAKTYDELRRIFSSFSSLSDTLDIP